MDIQLNNAYYFTSLNSIGGVESHLYYLAKKYGDRDWVVLCKSADAIQLQRLRKYVPVLIVKPSDHFRIKRLFVAYEHSIVNQCDADEIIFVIHSDYQTMINMGKIPMGYNYKYDGIDTYLAVSKQAQLGFHADSKVVYMPIELDICEEPILLVSATRLSPEKGLSRMKILMEALDKANVNYIWHVYTNSKKELQGPNIQFMKPRLDICDKLPLYSALVQLSDSESFGLSIQEALMRGVPVITTDLPVMKELGIDDRYSIRFPFNMENIEELIERVRHVNELKRNMPGYSPPNDKWGEWITEDKRKSLGIFKVQIIRKYYDMTIGRNVEPGEVLEVSIDRACYLVDRGVAKDV